jgi:hypothetical protein
VRDARELVVAAGRVKGGAEGEERAAQVGWKLYELTAFILILESLEEMGYSMGGKFGENLVFSRGSGSDERAVRILHDSPLDSSRMARAYPGSVDLEALGGNPISRLWSSRAPGIAERRCSTASSHTDRAI